MFMVPESPSERVKSVNVHPEERLQMLLIENESQIRRLELVKHELDQVRTHNFDLKKNLEILTQKNTEL